MPDHPYSDDLPFDKQRILARYEEERAKRIRPGGGRQYVEASYYLPIAGDPYKVKADRDPVVRRATLTFVGGGLAALITCSKLKQSGVTDLAVIEKGGDFGGTWYWNRYPGAQCDTASMVYLPFLEETGYMPSERYTYGPEIFSHCQRIGRTFHLYENALFHTIATAIEWDGNQGEWIISTDRGDEIRSRFVAIGTGQFHVPKIPKIPSINCFQGHVFHSSRWDYDYTGGDPGGKPMTRLADKRVGIVGTGATAVQCIPHLADASKELLVFQRTPSAVDVRANEPIDPSWFNRVTSHDWQSRWMINFVECRERWDYVEDLVNDGWTAISRRVREKLRQVSPADRTPELVSTTQEQCDYENMERIRQRVDQVVNDPRTAEGLKAWYKQFCKRPCFHDGYLQAFNRPTTRLIDTEGRGIRSFSRTGVLVGDEEYPLDCLIFATGFRTDPKRILPEQLRIVGENGLELSKAWETGMETLFGVFVFGFPNFFTIQPAQGANLLSNIPHNFADSAATVTSVVQYMLSHGLSHFRPQQEAQEQWVKTLLASKPRLALKDCTPGTFNNEGDPDDSGARRNVGNPSGPLAHFKMMQMWRNSLTFDGLSFDGG